MKISIILLIVLFFASCNQNPQEQISDDIIKRSDINISKKDIETIDYIDYGLSLSSKRALDQWKSYFEIQNLVISVKEGDLSYFISDKEIHQSLFDELLSTIPNKIKSDPVEARMKALKTKFFKLKSIVAVSENKQVLIALTKEFLIAFSNLNLQINKKLEKEAQDVSKSTT